MGENEPRTPTLPDLADLLEGRDSERGLSAWAAFDEIRRLDEEKNKLRKKHPWVGSLISILLSSPRGIMIRDMAISEVWKLRQPKGLSMPKKFEHTVQAVYNQNCEGYSAFVKRKLPKSEALFHSPEGKGTGVWAVHRERAAEWLRKHLETTSVRLKIE